MTKCERCGQEFDPAFSFINDPEDCEDLINFTSAEFVSSQCGECGERVLAEIKEDFRKLIDGR